MLSKGKIFPDPEVGEVRMIKSLRARRLTIRVHPTRGVSISIPGFVSYDAGLQFYKSKRDWVLKTVKAQRERRGKATTVTDEQVHQMRILARKILPARLASLAARYGLQYNRLALKNNVSNWGSCSAKNNINLNIRLMMLPERLQDYVILHELCHLKHHDHSPAFHALLESLCADHFGPDGTDAPRAKLPSPSAPHSNHSNFPVSRALERELRCYSPSFLPPSL